MPYILVDASGWVVSDVSFGFMGGFGSFNIRPPHPNDPVGIDLTPTPIPAANLRIHTRRKKMAPEKALNIILQQPIRAKIYWWLLSLSFKNREATLLCFFATMTSLFGYLFIPVMYRLFSWITKCLMHLLTGILVFYDFMSRLAWDLFSIRYKGLFYKENPGFYPWVRLLSKSIIFSLMNKCEFLIKYLIILFKLSLFWDTSNYRTWIILLWYNLII